MTNLPKATKAITAETWLNKHYQLKVGFVSVYDNEPFNHSNDSIAYELGRQMAIVAKASGHKTKGGLIRRKPNSNEFAWVGTKIREITYLVHSIGYKPAQLAF